MFISKDNYKACIYTRLSKDDGDKPESDSISNQKALIRDFLKNHPEIQALIKVLHSDEIKQFITEKYKGAVVPAF